MAEYCANVRLLPAHNAGTGNWNNK